jgi:hypothetical protein
MTNYNRTENHKNKQQVADTKIMVVNLSCSIMNHEGA